MIKKFSVDDIKQFTDDPEEIEAGKLSMGTGPAFSLFDDDGKLVGSGGVRVYGVGEAWLVGMDLENHKLSLLRGIKEKMDEIIREQALWRVYAYPKGGEGVEKQRRLIEHLGFTEYQTYIR